MPLKAYGKDLSRRNFLKILGAGTVLGASCSQREPCTTEIYRGQLPGYGITELYVFRIEETNHIFELRAKAEFINNNTMYVITDLKPEDNNLEFHTARSIDHDGHSFLMLPGSKDFMYAENFVSDVMSKKDNLQRVK